MITMEKCVHKPSCEAGRHAGLDPASPASNRRDGGSVPAMTLPHVSYLFIMVVICGDTIMVGNVYANPPVKRDVLPDLIRHLQQAIEEMAGRCPP